LQLSSAALFRNYFYNPYGRKTEKRTARVEWEEACKGQKSFKLQHEELTRKDVGEELPA